MRDAIGTPPAISSPGGAGPAAPPAGAPSRPRRRRGSVTEGRVLYGVTVSGSAALLRGQLAWFRARGWDVHLVTSPGEIAAALARDEGVGLHALPMEREVSARGDLLALWRWTVMLRRLRPEVVNLATPKAGLIGSLAAWVTRVPVRVYELWGLRLEGARTRTEAAVLWMAERLTIWFATDVVCVSHSLREEARRRRLFGRRDRPVVLGNGSSNGVDAARWDRAFATVDRNAVRAGWDAAPGDLVVGFVGRICSDKGVGDLLEAFRSVADLPVRLVLVGPVEDEGLRSRMAAAGDRVTHVDMTQDLGPVYVGMDVLCLPTYREGFPNVVLEAALAGVPAVTTTATGARDSVLAGRTGWLVEPGDVAGLAAVLRACAEDRATIRSFGRAARERALADFPPEGIWSALEQVYLGAAGRS